MVRATFAGFTTALSALQANQKRLDITGQNLANMNTPGYTRQQLETSSLNYTNPVSKYMSNPDLTVGFGVSMDRVSQIRDPYLDAQYRSQMSKSSYTDSIQTALDSLADVLDESNIEGIRQAFDNIQSSLKNMQNPDKVDDQVLESELRSRMQALTNLLNEAAGQIAKAEQAEYDRLNGDGTSENGAQQEVNDLIRQIADLNVQIKRNQVLGQPSLELMDERNMYLDELASYIPIEVSYFKDAEHSGDKIYEHDHNGNVIGKKDWPDDLKVDMIYTNPDGTTGRLTLINGSEGGRGNNYIKDTMKVTGDRPDSNADNYGAGNQISVTFQGFDTSGNPAPVVTISSKANSTHFSTGSVQAGLDMLESVGDGGVNNVNGYEYYNDHLDNLASTFAKIMNAINKKGAPGGTTVDYNLFTTRDNATGFTAANITINPDWFSGAVHVGTNGDNPTDTVLNMLEAMKSTYPYPGSNPDFLGNPDITNAKLGNKTFADYMNHVSTLLANDSLNNTTALKTNVTVLNGIQDSRDSVSGVSLDEEASNMMTYISAYNAASRLMTALDEALNTLINNTGLVGR